MYDLNQFQARFEARSSNLPAVVSREHADVLRSQSMTRHSALGCAGRWATILRTFCKFARLNLRPASGKTLAP